MTVESLAVFCRENNIGFSLNEPMKNHTSFRIGGNADIMIFPESEKEIISSFAFCKENSIPVFILGNGSNILVSDKGISGAVISLTNVTGISKDEDEITAFCGETLASVCKTALSESLSGLEFAYGIPASVGGAAVMNAGAYGGSLSDAVLEVRCFDGEKIITVKKEDARFGYRTSLFKENNYVVISVTFKLKKDDKTEIEKRMNDYISRRKSKQPLNYPSAGSVFKRPEGYFAGKLIEDCGLKGKQIGGAKVSELHAGFIINCKGATEKDVKDLIAFIKNAVKEKFQVELEREIIFVGRE